MSSGSSNTVMKTARLGTGTCSFLSKTFNFVTELKGAMLLNNYLSFHHYKPPVHSGGIHFNLRSRERLYWIYHNGKRQAKINIKTNT